MKVFKLSLFAGLVCTSNAWSAAYKVPEQSLNATALSAAYVANANGADSTYYNPAAMVFNQDRSQLEASVTLIHLPEIDFSGTADTALGRAVISGDSSKIENFIVPTFHYVSPAVDRARFGLSVVAPAGLSKRWKDGAQAFSEEFTLKTVEINPTAAYQLADNFSIGGGLRAVYSDGVVKSTFNTSLPGQPVLSRDLEGDSWDFGYNLALHFKPSDTLSLAATYRSRVDLTVEGDAELSFAGIPYDGPASVEVPIPAALNLAAAFEVSPKTTVELNYERTYWSSYKELDFNYPTTLPHPVLVASFDTPQARDYKDSNTWRIGLTHQYDDELKLMAGFAYDETPVPSETLGFELPDSDAYVYSFGAEYKMDDNMSIGGALLYSDKDSRSVDQTPPGITGEFKGAGAYLLTLALKYNF